MKRPRVLMDPKKTNETSPCLVDTLLQYTNNNFHIYYLYTKELRGISLKLYLKIRN